MLLQCVLRPWKFPERQEQKIKWKFAKTKWSNFWIFHGALGKILFWGMSLISLKPMQQVVKFLIWNLWKYGFWEMKFQNSWLGKSKSFHNSWLGISKSFHNSWLGFASSLVMKWFWYASSLAMKGFRYASSFVVKFHFSKTTFS